MNFDYISMITYVEVRNFITNVLTQKLNTNAIVKVNNIKTDARSYRVLFEVMGSNGLYITGEAVCTNFDCIITLSHNRTQTQINYARDWAKWVYSVLKAKEINGSSRMGSIYKADYNEHCEKIRDAKRAEAEKECEANLLK